MKAHLNPFAPDRVQRILPFNPDLIGTTWEHLETHWEKLHRRAAIVGPHGSGKTTFLNTFAERLAHSYHVETLFFHRNERHLSPTQKRQVTQIKDPARTVLLVDGEGHLTLRERHLLRRKSRKMAGYLTARHHRSILPTLLTLAVTPQLAHQLLAQIHPEEASRRETILPQLLRKKRGNLRELWLSFYDDYAKQDSPSSET